MSEVINDVSLYLQNFFSNSNPKKITETLEELDESILFVLYTLIETDQRYKQVIDKISHKIESLEGEVIQKNNIIERLQSQKQHTAEKMPVEPLAVDNINKIDGQKLNDIQNLRSSTSNPNLYNISIAIYDAIRRTSQPVDLLEIHKKLGQERIHQSFLKMTQDSTSKASRLLGRLFSINKINNKYIIDTSSYGNLILKQTDKYYKNNSIRRRYQKMQHDGNIHQSMQKILDTIAKEELIVSNRKSDRVKLASICGLNVDHLSRLIRKCVKLGFIGREIDSNANNKYYYRFFDKL